MTTVAALSGRYNEVKERIAAAARRSGRKGSDVVLIAVGKYAEIDQIRELIQLGQIDFGENRVDQAVQRAAMIDEWLARHRTMARSGWNANEAPPPPPAVRWHMIGHLQRNKVKKTIETCRLIHSVDSLRLAEEIQLAATRRERAVDVLLQVNTSNEESKYGCAVPAAVHLAEQINTMVQLRLRGLMTMAPLGADANALKRCFGRLRELFQDVRRQGFDSGGGGEQFNILSMGMSGDYEIAIEEGANMVRVGSAIFGDQKGPETEDAASEEDND